jgi:hypothetical protein
MSNLSELGTQKWLIKISKQTYYITITFIFLVFQYHLVRNNLFNNFFWLDESGQIWMAQGQNHFSPQGSPTRGIQAIMENNSNYNLDPGGFTLLLRVWVSITGFETFMIRLLPYSFYLLTILILALSVQRFVIDKRLRKLFLLLLLGVSSTPMVTYYAFEVRGYSLSLFLTTFNFYLLAMFLKSNGNLQFLLLSASLLATLTIRYTSIAYVISIFLVICYLEMHSKSYKRVFSLSVVTLFLSLYILNDQVLIQLLDQGDSYLDIHLLSRFENWPEILYSNFFGFPGFLRSLVLLLAVLQIRRTAFIREGFKQRNLSVVFSATVLVLTTLQILFSLAGYLPWHSSTRWSIEDLSFSVVLLIQLSSIFNKSFFEKQVIQRSTNQIIGISLIGVMLLIISPAGHKFRPITRNSSIPVSSLLFNPTNVDLRHTVFLVDQSIYPTLRYSFEFDPSFKSKKQLWLDATVLQFTDESQLMRLLGQNLSKDFYVITTNQQVRSLSSTYAGKIIELTNLEKLDNLAPAWSSLIFKALSK